jgi:hypothetical protein
MSTPTESEWLASVHRLRERLEQAEIRHRLVMAELKEELFTLEKRLPITEESPPGAHHRAACSRAAVVE